MPNANAIDATRIEQPEVERPDLYVSLVMPGGRIGCWHVAMSSERLSSIVTPNNGVFRLPGTRREKLTKALMEALAEWTRWPEPRRAEAVRAAYSNLLALDAEGVKG